MKGFKDSSGKFHPINQSKGVRSRRDTTKKTQGVRKAKNRFHPKGYKPPTFGKKKPEGKWEITETSYGSKNVVRDHDEVTIYDDNGQEVVKWIRDEWEEDPSVIPAIKNAIKLANEGKIDELKQRIGFTERGTVDRKAREFDLPLKQRKIIAKELSDEDFVILDQNPRWKLTHIVVDDGAEYYVFPDEDSAIAFGRQSIRDTASEYIPDEGSPLRDEYINLSDDDLVEKIIEEQSDFGQRSELGAVAQSVAGYDGSFTELSDGTIAFRVS